MHLPVLGVDVEAGAVFDCPDDLAGRPPSVSLDDDGQEVTDLGEGLLAQVGNYEVAGEGES
jgi:hypothetical protein